MTLKINGVYFILWRAVDSNGQELDIYLQKRRNKKAATRFLSRLLNCHPSPRVIITDKLRSYNKPIKQMMPNSEHRSHKGLNNRAENAHLATRRKEKSLIKFKSPHGVQSVLELMGKVRNIFSVAVGRYTKPAYEQRTQFKHAKNIWNESAKIILCA